ncbi:von Willebrand factor type A domain-containing protein [Saccharicrinis carchari]|uniref:von Willebrand factor type A domain-containing protein n=2 Tax=Saccharicrinis carchari TaxID=1168039 RepID=A0A521ARJ3_SACCC|nr:von Willebrand factor type A domain-containing protein [Saccharicrinis carchari]
MNFKLWNFIVTVFFLFIVYACEPDNEPGLSDEYTSDKTGYAMFNDARGSSGGSATGGGSSTGSGGTNQGNNAGLITAGEWNDLDNWVYWSELIIGQDYSKMPDYWGFYTQNRISVVLTTNGSPAVDTKLELKKKGQTVWRSKTDNMGRAELWIALFQKDNSLNMSDYDLYVNGNKVNRNLTLFENGVNKINITSATSVSDRVELAFVVDATGSMGDEMEFLKDDLKDVVQKVLKGKTNLDVFTSTVFYRDQGDEYLVKKSGFTSDINSTVNFIAKQRADGGGDFPEAVHTALKTAFNELQWSDKAKARIAFLLLDAPPHYTSEIIAEVQQQTLRAAEKGIKIIPVTASGIDKETEFLMRFMAMATNGTYIFITNDSGIGNHHIQASVGDYEVELLNDLLVRLIRKYSN